MSGVPPHLDHGATHPHGPDDRHNGPPTWDDLYASKPEWDINRPQPAFLALAEAGALRGRVLDVGCGTGEHVLMSAGLGLDATGIDLSSTAIHIAEQKARDRGLTAKFLCHDVRRLADLGESFDTVLDCGLFVHVFDDNDDRTAYIDNLRSVMPPGGLYFMLCFRGQQPHHQGLIREEIATAFADGWQVDSIEPATLDSSTSVNGILAWLVALTRTAESS
ncbi:MULTISPECIES: class I SAM-dependent methyltransferase [unclassified Streptomyces]|uniref:class I SAM-dependent methyltransferase n=1 Tax=unclassified Streptomyces TaxID=2593676 RepID=UPI002DDC2FB5|nr:class I SAM-dependent methyltransferase [Streptomyces sp. NBC_00243]WRZ17332.1 class I SAM-dependent methyltransferase [Streptomyces sp. NBC_00243]